MLLQKSEVFMRKYHVHVYKVINMCEVDTLAPNEVKAKEFALEAVKDGIIQERFPDCNFIAIEFDTTSKETYKI
jgi:hypothetical protein